MTPIALALALVATLAYPQARKDTAADDHFGHRVPAPYRWMEQLD